jgi:hypothetical protein
MTASLTDILTATKNIVTALNGAAQQTLLIAGNQVATGVTAATLVATGQGRVATVSVIVAGVAGKLYDASLATATTNPLAVMPATVGVFVVNLPFNNGLVIAPGAGQTVTVSFSG